MDILAQGYNLCGLFIHLQHQLNAEIRDVQEIIRGPLYHSFRIHKTMLLLVDNNNNAENDHSASAKRREEQKEEFSDGSYVEPSYQMAQMEQFPMRIEEVVSNSSSSLSNRTLLLFSLNLNFLYCLCFGIHLTHCYIFKSIVMKTIETMNDTIETRMETMNNKIEMIETRMETMNNKIETRMETMNDTIETMNNKIEMMETNINNKMKKFDEILMQLSFISSFLQQQGTVTTTTNDAEPETIDTGPDL